MIYKEKSKLCLSFFGITISSGLIPLFRYRDNGIINNLPDPEPVNKPDPMKEAKDAAAAAEKTSILEKLREEERARRERPLRPFLPGREEQCLE